MKKILFIEDDRQLQDTCLKKFTDEGFVFLQALDAQKGLAMVKSQNPDLILLDIMLPGHMNGFDILEQIEKNPNLAKIPVIVLTNLDSEEKVARSIGAKGYLVKANTSIDEIVETVKRHLNA